MDTSNLGSIELVGKDKQVYTDGTTRYIYSFQGLTKDDFSKLPIFDDMGAGSSCLFLDGNYARFHAKTQQWKLI